jgi:tRNA1Val (adenine37-N6)-methyltransferase
MANPWFRFKEFTIRQEQSAHKVGTDGVLLGAWADIEGVRSVLDIGTGTGLLALMIAQRSNAEISAIDIDLPTVEEALRNAKESPWSARINIIRESLQDFKPGRQFDMLISNPPFFRNSLLSSDPGKSASRHNTKLSVNDLVRYSKPLLRPRGRLCLVFPVEESRELLELCSEGGLSLHRRMEVFPTPSSPAKRYLLEFRPFPGGSIIEEKIIIEKGKRHDYTMEYRELTKDFYLKF